MKLKVMLTWQHHFLLHNLNIVCLLNMHVLINIMLFYVTVMVI